MSTQAVQLEIGLIVNDQRHNLAYWLGQLQQKDGSSAQELRKKLQNEINMSQSTVSLKVYDAPVIREQEGGFGSLELLLQQLLGVHRKLMRSGIFSPTTLPRNILKFLFSDRIPQKHKR